MKKLLVLLILSISVNKSVYSQSTPGEAPPYDDSTHFNATLPYTDENGNSAIAEGDYYVYKGNNNEAGDCSQNGCVKSPVVIVEGIDPGNNRNWPEIWQAMNQIYDETNPNRLVASQLHDEGHDVIVLNFTNTILNFN